MAKISVYIIGYNEERKIEAAIKSVIDWADEVLVVDSFSTDNTAIISKQLGAKMEQVVFEGFGKLRNDAVALCTHDWIFSLDADERCTPETQKEIQTILAKEPNETVAYYIPRRNYFLGQWIKHGGWFPDYRQPQLFKKGSLTYSLDAVHEGYTVHGKTDYLQHPIWQFPFENLTQMIAKTNRYSTLGAEKLKGKKKGGLRKALSHGVAIFFQTYFFKKGFLDGRAGFVIALSNFITTYYKYIKLAELDNNWSITKGELPK